MFSSKLTADEKLLYPLPPNPSGRRSNLGKLFVTLKSHKDNLRGEYTAKSHFICLAVQIHLQDFLIDKSELD